VEYALIAIKKIAEFLDPANRATSSMPSASQRRGWRILGVTCTAP
jgi:hypothetical protein